MLSLLLAAAGSTVLATAEEDAPGGISCVNVDAEVGEKVGIGSFVPGA